MNDSRQALRQYLLITGNYWSFTLTDGALRMLVLLHFHTLGYTPWQLALLFLFYELFGVITNLIGGWLGARIGLNRIMNIGLGLQVAGLAMLMVPAAALTVPWVMAAQALSGIAKDLNKMSAKSAIKLLIPAGHQGRLYHWVALLTGSKNALKGAGFFMGGALLAALGFANAVASMAVALALVWLASMLLLQKELGRASHKPAFKELFSKSRSINILSAARLLLFGARDVWFVIALPVFLSQSLGWSHTATGSFMAAWIIFYGIAQAAAPVLTRNTSSAPPNGRSASWLAAAVALVPALMVLGLYGGLSASAVVVAGLILFALLFALNSAVHSFLIVDYASRDAVSLDVGFYYMANAMGRLLGTLLSGVLFASMGQGVAGLMACLAASALMLTATAMISSQLPSSSQRQLGNTH
ncbi:MAG: organoarsenical effux MFS transporter ArsJ [Porticoccaceae bacterium]